MSSLWKLMPIYHIYTMPVGFSCCFLYNDSVADIILRTKLHIPVLRSSLVQRPRLIEKLNAGMDGRLILVSAQAGSGKTTLVTEGLSQSDCQAVWFSLDESDNDPRRFLDYLLIALRQVQAEIGAAAEAMLQLPQPPADEVLM